jgi:hypothetical protein
LNKAQDDWLEIPSRFDSQTVDNELPKVRQKGFKKCEGRLCKY